MVDLGAEVPAHAWLESPLTLSALEKHSGLVFGFDRSAPPHPPWPRYRADPTANPRAVLERLVRQTLAAGPCTVQFSGGRDSSLVLAVAVHVARRDGLPLPRAVAVRYLGAPSADEAQWQQLVVEHLQVPLEVITVPPGANEIVGPLAVSRLLRDGPTIPPPAGVNLARIGPAVAGTTVLTGEGGDEILGAERITRWLTYLHAHRIPRGSDAREMAEDVAFGRLKRAVVTRRLKAEALTPWLRPAALDEVTSEWVDEICSIPWDWRRATWSHLNLRRYRSYATLAAIAGREGFRLEHPLIHPDFVAALCRRGGATGYSFRSRIMRMLASDLLPDSVSRRRTKATFNEVYVGEAVRSFARSWDGGGVDETLVDAEALRTAWQAELIPGPSLAPLQYALLDALESGWEPSPVAESTS